MYGFNAATISVTTKLLNILILAILHLSVAS